MQNFSVGIAFFLIGLFKKVVLADEIQPFVGPVFEASPGYALTVLEAWGGALAYTLQLYFDFSGYSDMAIGLSKMFNVDLPLNFNSPYKATSIIEFWRRWHMTLSRFLRDYLYVGLGGNRKGPGPAVREPPRHDAAGRAVARRRLDVHRLGRRARRAARDQSWLAQCRGRGGSVMTFRGRLRRAAPPRCWRPSRASSWPGCSFARRPSPERSTCCAPCSGRTASCSPWSGRPLSPAYLPMAVDHWRFGTLEAFGGLRQCVWSAALLAIVFCIPNSQTLVGRFEAMLRSRGESAGEWAWCATGFASTLVFVVAAINDSRGVSEFIYFNF